MITDSATALTIRVPTALQVIASFCHATVDGMLAGTVRVRGDSVPPRNVLVVAEWNEATPNGRRFGGKDARTDARGGFRMCGVPVATSITLRIQTDSGSAEPLEVRIPISDRFAYVELILDRDVARGGSLSGVVLSDVNGQPMADVEVAIPELSKNVFTNDRGAFRISDIPAGMRTVVARKVGYHQFSASIAFAGNQAVERSLVLSRIATLDTIAVTVSVVLPEFEEHRRLGFGRFLTRADIEKVAGQPIANRLSQIGGVAIVRGLANQGWILNSRPRTTANPWCPTKDAGGNVSAGMKCGCYAKVYLDKALMNPGEISRQPNGRITRPTPPFDVNSIPSAMIEAVEWYAGPLETPPKYNTLDSECGVLVIHTRRSN